MKHHTYIKHLTRLFTACCLAATLTACNFESEGVYVDDTTEPSELYDYYVDEYGNEGVVVYMLNSLHTYQIVLSADEAYLPWGPTGERVYDLDTVPKTDLTDASFGVAMLQTMKARGIDRYPAQAWCDRKNHDEEHPQGSSWRLPTYWEMVIIFGASGARVEKINTALRNIGGTPLTGSNYYWSCAEDFEGYAKINNVSTDYDRENRAVISTPMRTTTSTKDRWMKKNSHYVRAIKYIYYEEN